MSSGNKRLKIFSGNANKNLALEICQYLGVTLGDSNVKRFSDGEIQVRIK